MGNECCKARWNPCPGLDVSSNVDTAGPRYQINRNPFWRQKFLIGDKEISTPKGLQNPAYHEDFDSTQDKNRSSNGWERPTLTVPTEAVAAAIAAATAATAPIPPPRTKRNRRATTQSVSDSPLPATPNTCALYPQKETQNDVVTDKSASENSSPEQAPLESPKDTTDSKENINFLEESKDRKEEVPADEPKDITDNKNHVKSIDENTIGSQNVVVTCTALPSVDENSILNCSNTVDLLRTVRHSSIESEALAMKSDFSDDYPIIPAKRRTQKSDERKGSSVSLPGDDVLAKSELERSHLTKFKYKEKRGGEVDLSVAGTEEDEREEIKSRIKGEATNTDDEDESSSDSESEQEDVLRRSSASSGTIEPYDTACSGDETKELAEEYNLPRPSFESLSPPPTPENSPRRGSIDDSTDAPVVTQRSASENADSIARSMSPNLTQIALSKSAILLTPRQWKPAPTSVMTPEHRSENVPEVNVTAEPSDHQKHTRDAMTSFIKGTYSDKLEVPDRPDSAASSTTGSLGELEEDIYKLLSESKDKHCEDDDDSNETLTPTPTPTKVSYQEEPQSAISDVPICSSAELVRKQQELYIRSMRELRSEDGREQ